MKKIIIGIVLTSLILQMGCARTSSEEKNIIDHFDEGNNLFFITSVFNSDDKGVFACALGYYEELLREKNMGGWYLSSSKDVSQEQIKKINLWLINNAGRNGENKWKLLIIHGGEVDYFEIERRNIDLRLIANESKLCVPISRAALKRQPGGGVIFMDIKDN